MLAQIDELRTLRNEIALRYMCVMFIDSPRWTVAALYRIGYSMEEQAGILAGASIEENLAGIDPDAGEERVEQIIEQIEELRHSLIEEAGNLYLEAIGIAREKNVESEWTAQLEERIVALGLTPGSGVGLPDGGGGME